ncbi:SPARC-related modular calcium-binding protein 1-like [Oppia nitens]|uniref:SPARC-related modular calcium-binding protein 1-like n=1 Tax=Oppia nitens TaxID=1686743 RepID=UPI0023DB9240|nr:SPARC-related modular calcium-binding protein 1-like [Oppia nitens]
MTDSLCPSMRLSLISLLMTLIVITNDCNANDCLVSRSAALTDDKDVFVPECTRDGLFASVQCHRSSGYCWCVDVMTGRPKSRTTTHNGLPNCNNSGRRSATRDSNSKTRRKDKRLCNSSQRVLFNTQLLGVFVSENTRKTGHQNESSISASIESKFNELDLNLDEKISKQETKDLIQLIKKLFPLFRVCAQQMFTFCDQNNDSFVTKAEFKECLNFDFSFRAFLSLNSTNGGHSSADTQTSAKKGNGFQNPFELNQHSSRNVNESRLDCYITRANALESKKVNPNGELFIPECTKDGYYVRVQCHKSSAKPVPYCWCVSRVSGQTIKTLPTSVSITNGNQNNCESIRKGCDQRRRNKFHQKLREYLEKDNNSCQSAFDRMDTNRDMFLENSEWKQFRQTWRKTINSRLRKCFRTEINYCDQNYDKKLSKQEWVQCCQPLDSYSMSSSFGSSLAISDDFVGQQQRPMRTNKRGPNPFKTILKSE